MHATTKPLLHRSIHVLALIAAFASTDALAATCAINVFPPCYNPTATDASHNTAGGSGALPPSASQYSTAFGESALAASGGFSAAFGAGALQNSTGTYNTAVGFATMFGNLGGSYNTALGSAALHDNTSGTGNVAVGSNTLYSSNGSQNTAVGVASMFANTSGHDNTAIGYTTLVSNTSGILNTALGAGAMFTNTIGNSNTAFGRAALYKNSTGNSNMAMGNAALNNNATGSGNIAIGASAGTNLTGGNSNIYLGSPGGTATETKVMRLGGVQTATFVAGIAGVSVGNAVEVVVDSTTGQLGIFGPSSVRYKDDVREMADQAERLAKLRPVTFRYKSDKDKAQQYGLIAEEVASVYPEMVARNADGQIEAVQYSKLIPLLLKQIQRQQEKIASQDAAIAAMNERLSRIEAGPEHLARR